MTTDPRPLAPFRVPVEPSRSGVTRVDLREIMQQRPHLDSNDQTFTSDVMAAANAQPSMPEALSWE